MGKVGLDKLPERAGFHENVGVDDEVEKLAWKSCLRQGEFHANGVGVDVDGRNWQVFQAMRIHMDTTLAWTL
jgi:hypothetical protein